MMKQLKNQFMQAAFLTTIWVLLLTSLGFGNPTVELTFFWHLIGIGVLVGGTFGVIYPYVWNYGTWAAPVNILVTTAVNFLAGFISVYLFSTEMFTFIQPLWPVFLVINLIIHSIVFYFYRNHLNKVMIKELNQLSK